MVELNFKRWGARSRDVNGTPRMVFTEARWSADSKDLFDGCTGIKFAANDFNLTFDAAKRRNNE